MPFKINISDKHGKTHHLEAEGENLMTKTLREKINGSDVSPEMHDYEFEITGASDKAGFPLMENIEGVGLKHVLTGYGKGMKKRSKREGKRKRSNPTPKGLRLRKTFRSKIISPDVVQINLKVLKEGEKKLAEIFPEQNKPKQKEEVKITA